MHFSPFVLAALSALITTGVSQTIDPNSVPLATRNTWCTSQIAACPLICTQETNGSAATDANTCDPSSLSYSCICDNGLSPNISEYSQTIPYYTCTESNIQCVANCGTGNNACASACNTDNPCGAQNPTRVNTTSSSTTASGTATSTGTSGSSTATAVYSGFGTSASSTSSSSSNSQSSSSSSSGASRILVNFGQIYGLGLVAASVFAGFAVLL